MTYSMHPAPAPGDTAALAAITAAFDADLADYLGDRHGKTVLVAAHPDGCRSAILLMDTGAGQVRAWPEIDLDAIEWGPATDRHGMYWFLDPADLANLGERGCAQHTSAHWRAEHLAGHILAA